MVEDLNEINDDISLNDEEITPVVTDEETPDDAEFDEDGKLIKNSKMKCTPEQFQKLLEDNINFPYSIVNKEFSKFPWNVREDLNAAAMEGMVYAATKYDPNRAGECKFISYAVHWIRYFIKEQIKDFYPVRFNQNFISKRNKVNKCIAEYKKNNDGNEPSVTYISGQVGMSEKVVRNILNVNGGENFTFLSFNMPVESEKGDGESESLNNDRLVKEYIDNEAIDSSCILKIEMQDLMEQLKKVVPTQDYNIFYDYYFMGENFSDLAKKYGLKFPSSAAYLIKKCEKKCKELMAE